MPRTFISPQDGQVYFRTVLLTPAHAASFCKCLRANRRFRNARVVDSRTEGKAFVQYQPSSQARYADIYAREYEKREEKGKTEGRCYDFDLDTTHAGNPFYRCHSTSGEVYDVTEHGCSCNDFTYRCKKAGLPCKHQVAYFAQVALGDIKSLVDVRNAMARAALVASMLPKQTLQQRFAAHGLRPDKDFA